MFCTTNIIYDPSVATNAIPVSLDYMYTLEMEKEDSGDVSVSWKQNKQRKTTTWNYNNNNKHTHMQSKLSCTYLSEKAAIKQD